LDIEKKVGWFEIKFVRRIFATINIDNFGGKNTIES
jgi:hypothetical protein